MDRQAEHGNLTMEAIVFKIQHYQCSLKSLSVILETFMIENAKITWMQELFRSCIIGIINIIV